MPDRRRHRGPHPEDAESFAPARLDALRQSVSDLAWLLGRGYRSPSAIKLVGDRYRLNERQRMAVLRCACADADRDARRSREVQGSVVSGQTVVVDTYNALTTVESALSGAVVLGARDGCLRDLASMHGTFHGVDETDAAFELLTRHLAALRAVRVCWLLDSPVSNSGRLAARMRQALPQEDTVTWDVQLVTDPDACLRVSEDIVATADSAILDAGPRWYNLARHVIVSAVADFWMVDLS